MKFPDNLHFDELNYVLFTTFIFLIEVMSIMGLKEKYNNAVAKFVKVESKKQSVLGIFVTGSFVTGNIGENSDVDIFILHDKEYSQVKATFIDDIEFECAYKSYNQFLQDIENKNPVDISRYAQAKILYAPKKDVSDIISRAKKIFNKGLQEMVTDSDKYHLKDMMEDIEDNLDNPATLITIMNAFDLLLKIFYKKNKLWGAKEKALIGYLNLHDKKMAKLTVNFLSSKKNEERFVILKKIRTHVMNGIQPLPKLWKTKKKYL